MLLTYEADYASRIKIARFRRSLRLKSTKRDYKKPKALQRYNSHKKRKALLH